MHNAEYRIVFRAALVLLSISSILSIASVSPAAPAAAPVVLAAPTPTPDPASDELRATLRQHWLEQLRLREHMRYKFAGRKTQPAETLHDTVTTATAKISSDGKGRSSTVRTDGRSERDNVTFRGDVWREGDATTFTLSVRRIDTGEEITSRTLVRVGRKWGVKHHIQRRNPRGAPIVEGVNPWMEVFDPELYLNPSDSNGIEKPFLRLIDGTAEPGAITRAYSGAGSGPASGKLVHLASRLDLPDPKASYRFYLHDVVFDPARGWLPSQRSGLFFTMPKGGMLTLDPESQGRITTYRSTKLPDGRWFLSGFTQAYPVKLTKKGRKAIEERDRKRASSGNPSGMYASAPAAGDPGDPNTDLGDSHEIFTFDITDIEVPPPTATK